MYDLGMNEDEVRYGNKLHGITVIISSIVPLVDQGPILLTWVNFDFSMNK